MALLRRHLLAALLVPACGGGAHAAEADWRAALPGARLLGEGLFRWFGLQIYTARLWSGAPGTFDATQPFALELTYHRSIRREQFVESSVGELQRLQPADSPVRPIAQWRTLMQGAFTDVAAGDQLTGLYLGARGCRFYSRTALLADIGDAAFASAFFDIWLNPRTHDAQLRRQLLGEAAP